MQQPATVNLLDSVPTFELLQGRRRNRRLVVVAAMRALVVAMGHKARGAHGLGGAH